MTTLERSQQLDLLPMQSESMLSAAGFHASILATQDRKRESAESAADCGKNTPELLASYDRNTQLWKTSQRCFIEGWEPFSETWPRSGMVANGIAYQLPTLAHLTNETEPGLLPTPTAHNSKEGAYPAEFTRNTPTLAAVLGGKINPQFTEWMMGFPIDHTALKL